MPLKNGRLWEERFFRELSALPLPGAAVVIDVRDERYCDDHDTPLIEYLAIELEDLTVEMRLNQMARWRHLADCIEFLRIEAIPPDAIGDDQVDYKLTTRTGKQIPVQGRDDLAKTIGRGYIDRVRNQRISAINDSMLDEQELDWPRVDPEQPTVRVYFLTDMADAASLARAGKYAQWLKEWMDEQHGDRIYNRDSRISTIALCMNAPVNGQEELLLELGSPLWSAWPHTALMPYTALDMVILIQTYRDDGAYIGGTTQIYQTELILYTLLLHWPRLLTTTGWETMDDPDNRQLLPWPVYTVGISALEYSARWASRWLDYGLAAKSLELMCDENVVVKESKFLRSSVRHWVDDWWQEVQTSIPEVLYGVVPGIDGPAQLQSLMSATQHRSRSLRHAQEELQRFHEEINQIYGPSGSATLQRALDEAPFLIEQVKQKNDGTGSEALQVQHASMQLNALYTRAQRFVDDHFQNAWGAIPRVRTQIAALRESTNHIRAIQHNLPNIEAMRKQIEFEIVDAKKHLASSTRTWKLPFVGEVLQSTVISILVVLVLAIVCWFAIANTSIASSNLQKPLIGGITWLHLLSLLFFILVESGYLFFRNRALHLELQSLYQKLRVRLSEHMTEVSQVIAANAALDLLECAELYLPGEETSPCEERLKQMDTVLKKAQKAARRQQTIATQRLRFSLDQKPLKNTLEHLWPDLNNRKELLTWESVKSAYLDACKKLENGFSPLDTLSEVLVRRQGTEGSEAILQSLLLKAPAQKRFNVNVHSILEKKETSFLINQDDEANFQTLSTMLVGVLLTTDSVSPGISDVLPLINRYVQQQNMVIPEPSLLSSDVLNLNGIVREVMLEQALYGQEAVSSFSLKRELPAEFIFTAWIKQQDILDSTFVDYLAENDVVERLTQRKFTIQQMLEHLRGTTRLDGYPDEITGDDQFYLMLAPGALSSAFIATQERGKVTPTLFPDAEKIVYLHIHRLRRLLPGAPLLLK